MVRRAETIVDPRPHARSADLAEAGVQKVVRVGVLGKVGGHRADHAQLVRVLRHLGKQVAHRQARLAVLLELPRAGKRVAAAVELRGLHLQAERFAVFLR